MNLIVFMVVRLLLGLFVLVFGLDKFLEFLPALESMSKDAMTYSVALVNSKTWY